MKVLDRNAAISVTKPNWTDPMGVEYSFKTGIITSRDGHEQREALRQRPRVSLQFTTALTRGGVLRHHADMAKAQEGPTAVRAEWHRAELASYSLAGSTAVFVEEEKPWLIPGERVILTTEDSEDVYEVADVSATEITLADATIRDYPAGTSVTRAYWTRPSDTAEMTLRTDMVRTGKARFDAIPGTFEEVYKKSFGWGFRYNELFLKKPNWMDSPRLTFIQEREEFDPGIGLTDVITPHLADHVRFRMGFTGRTAEEANDLIGFFLRHKGRRGQFWMPTWSRDILPTDTSFVHADRFEVSGSEFRQVYLGHPVFNTVIAWWPDGTQQVNQIVDIVGSENSTLLFGRDWEQTVNSETKVMWCPLCRFDTDTLDVRWHTDSVAEMTFTIRTLYSGPGYWPDGLPSGGGFGGMEVIGTGPVPVYPSTPTRMSILLDLREYGLSDADIASGKCQAALRWSGKYETGTPLAGGTTTPRLNIVFHERKPESTTDAMIDPLPGEEASFSETQVEIIDAEVAPVTIPPGTKFIQFRASYDDSVTEKLTHYERIWAIGRNS